MSYSAVETIIPFAIHGTGNAMVVFLSDGPFLDDLYLGKIAISFRSCFISLSYGILSIHFLYRYLALFQLDFFKFYHKIKPMLRDTFAVRKFFYNVMMEYYNCDSFITPLFAVTYKGFDTTFIIRSWICIFIATFISLSFLIMYVVIGIRIMKNLKINMKISKNNKKVHRQLLKVLIVQTSIPICISFLPCVCAWYLPICWKTKQLFCGDRLICIPLFGSIGYYQYDSILFYTTYPDVPDQTKSNIKYYNINVVKKLKQFDCVFVE
ncbi:unnamed protein product [Caenorhabditis bovis]|uniref:Uncharacterized protein n=1 Tax=Caenorhabditis bovis TaxID=2654633 RepID=A0A8S1EE77_9PELO|nr:unnamed protein product [Caenorhabditis bovis]